MLNVCQSIKLLLKIEPGWVNTPLWVTMTEQIHWDTDDTDVVQFCFSKLEDARYMEKLALALGAERVKWGNRESAFGGNPNYTLTVVFPKVR